MAPVIFAMAPVINTIVSLFWHPNVGPFAFGMPAEPPHWLLYVGIVAAGVGAGMVLFAKELTEMKHAAHLRASAARRPGGIAAMTPEEAVQRLNTVLAHAWMVRTFLKHADEIQDDEELMDVPRTVFDYVRAG